MPRKETIVSIFVGSPSDVSEERKILESVINEINISWSKNQAIRFELKKWETYVVPGVGDDPQDVINKQISNEYDIFIGIMWKRFGTPTSRSESGTLEEFEIAYNKYSKDKTSVKIMIYFNDTPIKPSEIDTNQLNLVNIFKSKLSDKGILYYSYSDLATFESLCRMHLSKQLQDYVVFKDKNDDQNEISKIDLKDIAESNKIPDDDDKGLLDFIDKLYESFESLQDVTENISEATEEIGEKFSIRSQEVTGLQIDDHLQRQVARRSISKMATDLQNYNTRLNAEVPLFTKFLNEGMEAFNKGIILSRDFENSELEIENSLNQIREFSKTIIVTKEQMQLFRNSVAAMPRIQSDFNKQKTITTEHLDDIISSMEKAYNISNEILSLFDNSERN
jgi:hypothetical protein